MDGPSTKSPQYADGDGTGKPVGKTKTALRILLAPKLLAEERL